MTPFIREIAHYIAVELSRKLSDPGDDRIGFAGPPDDMLAELFDALVSEHGGITVSTASGEITLPTYLLTPDAGNMADLSSSCRCNQQGLTKVRTHGPSRYLFLLPCTEALIGTHTGTTETIGLYKPLDDLDDWLLNPLVHHLVDKALTRHSSPGVQHDKLNTVLEVALHSAWDSDEGHRDRRNTWKVLQRLVDLEVSGVQGFEAMCAILGLPRSSATELGTQPHCKLLGRLADLFEGSGLRPGLAWLQEQADDQIAPSIQAFTSHLLGCCKTSSDFASAPTAAYSPLNGQPGPSLPEWWLVLTLQVWERLLDTSDEKPQSGLMATCCNTLFPPLKGLPSVVASAPQFEVKVDGAADSVNVAIERAIDGKRFQPLDAAQVPPNAQQEWADATPEDHAKQLRYRFSAEGYKSLTRHCIALELYAPGVVVYSRNARQISPFRLNKKARDTQGRRVERYECEVSVHGIGNHQLDLYTRENLPISAEMVGFDADSGQDEGIARSINRTSASHAVCIIETDEECFYEFQATPNAEEEEKTYRIWIEAEEEAPTGALSEFDRLVIEHIAGARGERANARVEPLACRATDLQIWAIEDQDSLYPLVLGPDYLDAWRKPDYKKLPIISNLPLMLDPRPSSDEFKPPSAILDARLLIQNHIRPDPGNPTNPIELAHLGEKMCEKPFRDLVLRYLDLYRQWLEADPTSAIWMDVTAIHSREGHDSALSAYPYAILLSPLHPLRLGWQCKAQHLLKDALDNHHRCPGASLLDPTAFPDCLLLPCKTATGRAENKAFVSISNTSDYWSVLWNTEEIGRLAGASDPTIFGPDLGIMISGLASGFSVQQVVKSISEVARLSAGKTTLSVALASDTTGSSSCNDGVDLWANENLGPDGDEWHRAGGRSVRIYDERDSALQPEQAALASLTARTKSAIRWFTGPPSNPSEPVDLGIVAHLGTASPSFQVEGMRSAVDPTGLARCRVRKQVGTRGDFIAESRIGTIPPQANLEPFSRSLLAAVDATECTCRDVFDSYVFAPKLPTLENMIRRARYCAVSSSSVDAACFFKATELSYLWDYELPPYGRRAGENSGYFLLARESPTMSRAVRAALQVICPGATLADASIHSLLREISRRGMPTLRRLTTGGAASLGEVGMLVALRVLQSEFIEGDKPIALVPVHAATNELNLIVPADPFKDQFDQLRASIPGTTAERPDLLVLGIKLLNGSPVGIRVTPVEVKARTTVMSITDKQAALSQASAFAGFLASLSQVKAKQSEIWAITWRSLLSSLIDYAFRVYGQLPEFITYERWSAIHCESLRGVMAGTLATEIDPQGRLIVIEKAHSSYPEDVDGDGFKETIVLSHADAHKLVTGQASAFVAAATALLGNWKLPLQVETPTVSQQQPLPTAGEAPVQTSTSSEPSGQQSAAPTVLRPSVLEPEVNNLSPQVAATPASVGLDIPVGTTIDVFQQDTLRFRPGNTALNQLNVGIVGDLGTGKTQLVQALIHQLTTSPEHNRGMKPRFLIFDYKKDYIKEDFLKATGARVIAPHQIPVNYFDTRDSLLGQDAWLERSKFFSDALDKIYSGMGAPQRHRIKTAVRDSYQHARDAGRTAPSIYDVFSAYAAAVGTQIDSPYSIMSDLVDGKYFAAEESDILPFSQFMNGVIVINLAAVGQDDRTKNMLVVFLLNLFYEHMLKIEKRPFVGKDPQLRFVDTFLLVDEADNIMKYEFDVLRKVLLQGREFGVGVILASQYLSHFRTRHENYCEPLLSWFVHKVPNVTVRELESIGLTKVDSSVVARIKALGRHECLYKTFDNDGVFIRGTPFYELVAKP